MEVEMSTKIPDHVQVVIIGGGIVGCSVAYHLTKLDWSDVLVLERKELGSGTTWAAAGLLAQLRQNQEMTNLAKYTVDLYEKKPVSSFRV
jgi:4-methylaminobutanoate oxidase (formaldehyde-forming)